MAGKDLDRYLPVELGVLGSIHLAHPARAYEREDLIGAKTVTYGEGHFDCNNSTPQASSNTRCASIENPAPAKFLTCRIGDYPGPDASIFCFARINCPSVRVAADTRRSFGTAPLHVPLWPQRASPPA